MKSVQAADRIAALYDAVAALISARRDETLSTTADGAKRSRARRVELGRIAPKPDFGWARAEGRGGGDPPFLSEALMKGDIKPAIDGIHCGPYAPLVAPKNWACKCCGPRHIWLNAFAALASG